MTSSATPASSRSSIFPASSRHRALTSAWASALALAAIALQSPAQASARTSDEDARAEVVFNMGKQLRDAGQYAEACPKFAESERLAPGVGVMLHLADCYERAGRTASAWAKFRQAEQLAFQRGDCRVLLAHTRAAALEPRLNRLTVAIAQPQSHMDWELQLDGSPLPRDYWNAEMATDPGYHVVTVKVPGQALRTLVAHVDVTTPDAVVTVDEAGARATDPGGHAVTVDAPGEGSRTLPPQAGAAAPAAVVAVHEASPGSPPALAPPPAPEAQTSSSNAATWHMVERGLLGVTVVGVGVGASLLAVKNQAVLNSRSGTSNDSSWAGPASAIAFAAGGAALAAAIVVYLTAPSDKSTGAILAPVPMVGGGGAVIRTSF
jgi:hypothetical protein